MSPIRRPTSSTSTRCTRSSSRSAKTLNIFGVDAKKELSIDQLVDASAEYNIQSREEKLVDEMVIYLLKLPDRKAR